MRQFNGRTDVFGLNNLAGLIIGGFVDDSRRSFAELPAKSKSLHPEN